MFNEMMTRSVLY